MKKSLFIITSLSLFLLVGCRNSTEISQRIDNNDINTQQENIQQSDINEILKTIVHNHESCNDNSKLFVDIAILGNSTKDNGNTEYYLVTNGECFTIDERGNLGSVSGFGNVPTTIELSQNKNGYNLVIYEVAKDGNEYDSSTKEMFSDKAYKIRKDAKYAFINDKTLLEQAEEYFNVKIIPEGENNFECKFCDKLWYYEPLENEDGKSNKLIYNYISEDNGNNTIYFSSDGTFKAEGSWDTGEGTRTFGQNENTVIVLNSSIEHVYDRYIITNVDENNLNTILEIIQRM